ncbi:MAG: hypothetical protein JNK54_07660 [Elusimicrobia bacterium]|jgi:hypothetical protein|nr:hypothetical protein [Elusimicrobiota bacterium]
MDEAQEKRERHITQILKITAYAGWALALVSIFLGSYLLNRYHLEIIAMQQENKELKISLERARVNLRNHQAPPNAKLKREPAGNQIRK